MQQLPDVLTHVLHGGGLSVLAVAPCEHLLLQASHVLAQHLHLAGRHRLEKGVRLVLLLEEGVELRHVLLHIVRQALERRLQRNGRAAAMHNKYKIKYIKITFLRPPNTSNEQRTLAVQGLQASPRRPRIQILRIRPWLVLAAAWRCCQSLRSQSR